MSPVTKTIQKYTFNLYEKNVSTVANCSISSICFYPLTLLRSVKVEATEEVIPSEETFKKMKKSKFILSKRVN